MYNNDEINELRSHVNIVDIVSSYLPLTKAGKNYKGLCPFHTDHSPSMMVSEEKQIFKCFVCGHAGNVFNFVEDYEHVSFIEAVKIIADKSGYELSSLKNIVPKQSTVNKKEYELMNLVNKYFQNNLKTEYGKEALEYLHNRGINDDVIKEYGIGLSLDNKDTLYNFLIKKDYKNKDLIDLGLVHESNNTYYDFFRGRITFPLFDKDGNIVGFSGRVYRGEKDISKYMNSSENKIYIKGNTLYNYHIAKPASKREKCVIVVEGFMDAIRLSSCGIKNVVALQGTALTQNQIKLLQDLRCKVILMLDNDDAGELATVNNGEELLKNNIDLHVVRLSGEKDPDEYILKEGIEAMKDNINHAISFYEFKTKYYKKNKDLSNPEDLAEYINQVLKEINLMKDPVKQETELNRLSSDYNISKEVLRSKLDNILPVKEIKEDVNRIDTKKKTAYTISSEKILYFMMNGSEYIKEYQAKLGFFNEEIYRDIANEIVYFSEKNNGINVADFVTYIEDKDIKDKVKEIVSESFEDNVSVKVMDDYIVSLNKITTKNEIERLRSLMREELDVDKKTKLAMQIAELKKDVLSDARN